MKKSHIIALGVIAVAIIAIISMVGDASTYASFSDAKELAENGSKSSVHVVGELKKDHAGNISGMKYNPMENPDKFEFVMIDSLQNEARVILNKPKPQDLDKSEKVVVVGTMNLKDNYFSADEILLKCPSKYNNGEGKLENATAKL